MAATLKIKQGAKLAMAFDVPAGKNPEFNLVCSFFKELNEASFLISIPMKGGKPLQVGEDQKLLIRYDQNGVPMIVAGFLDGIVKQGLRNYWKIRRVTDQRTFFQRTEERVKATFHVAYTQPTWHANYDGIIEPEDALTLDISTGGLALYINRVFDVGEVCEVTLPTMGTTAAGKAITLLAEACWNRQTPRGSAYKNLCGLKFCFKDERVQKRVASYVKNVKKYSA